MSTVDNATFDVALEGRYINEVKKQERKASAEALVVVKKVLINAGMDEGLWFLRDPKRITKKGPQKFKVIRVESRGGLKFIRFWCKPRGNDTSYEYSLMPPSGVDVEKLFLLLKRTDSISLEIPESLDLPLAVFQRIADIKPVFKPLPKKIEAYEHKEEEKAKTESSEEKPKAEVTDMSLKSSEISEELNRKINQSEVEKISSLLILDPIMLYEQEAMDKALIAFGMCCEKGYVKRIVLSSCIKENLGIKKYVEEYCEGLYATVESAMKSLLTALVNNKYIERSRWNTTQENESGGIKGYTLTDKGGKRIIALLDRCSEDISSKIKLGLTKQERAQLSYLHDPNTQKILEDIDEEFDTVEDKARAWKDRAPEFDSKMDVASHVEDQKKSDSDEMMSEEITIDGIERLKNIIKKHDKATAEISDTDVLIGDLLSEKKELAITQNGFKLAEEEKIRQIKEIEEELKIIRSKRKNIEENIERKQREIESWEQYKKPFENDLVRAEEEISRLTGRRKV